MAYTKIRNIKSSAHLTDAINYAAAPTKILETLTAYAENKEKTIDGARFVSGINCVPETAAQAMMATKRRFGKETGRIAYHIIQSFRPGEVTPELAHQIGKQYAERWLSEFEVVIGTHLDRKHIHNHLIINSVSCVTGKKFHISRGDFYEKLRGISDELCRENGLSVIEYIDGKNMTYEEYLRRHSGGRTLRQIVKDDIETCIGKSFSLAGFYINLEDMGYEVDAAVTHPKIRAPDARKFMRLSTLGYPTERIYAAVAHDKRRMPVKKAKRYYTKQRYPRRKLSGIEALYIYYLFLLGKLRQKPHDVKLPISEYRKFYRMKEQLAFVTKNHFTKLSEVVKTLEQVNEQLKKLQSEQYRLRGARRKFKPLFEAHSIYERYSEIPDKLDEERRVMLEQAKEVIRKSGYADHIEAIRETRIALIGAISKNREEIQRLKKAKRSLGEVIEGTKSINNNLLFMKQGRKQKKKADNSLER
ncbi:relaxase/mobilization nuclease domain-containing protein [Christensenella tenuis]|uniref:Relaxase/mobilization nuclease domain-containing protein n=1 Tax=Christensenella tenuis TaxID=2763033 RepID=A0ABR7EG85_9FIRM|nr:relaxase/mobilization nuclease domain-containing protein [Christensenella tenuis]MBC5648154.1 relaxase/mobilization nuclease domain-containing protein [Christensenella tenuis]